MNEKGLGIIECLVAAVIVGIGFVAVYSLSTASTNILLSSIEREKGNMISNMIFEDIANSTVPSNAMNILFNNFELVKFFTISIISILYIFLY